MDFDLTQIGTGIAAVGASIWAAYQNWDEQTKGVRIAMIIIPVALVVLLMMVMNK